MPFLFVGCSASAPHASPRGPVCPLLMRMCALSLVVFVEHMDYVLIIPEYNRFVLLRMCKIELKSSSRVAVCLELSQSVFSRMFKIGLN